MDIERSRNGYYTVTFVNSKNLTENEISKRFNSVGYVCSIVISSKRVFIRYNTKEEAIKALTKFRSTLGVTTALNTQKFNENQGSDQTQIQNKTISRSSVTNMNIDKDNYHLILANLPKTYTINDIKTLVEEVKPVAINDIEETRGLHIKFCHIVLNSAEHLSYLINKLHEFVICGEKLIAVEAKKLLKWRENFVDI